MLADVLHDALSRMITQTRMRDFRGMFSFAALLQRSFATLALLTGVLPQTGLGPGVDRSLRACSKMLEYMSAIIDVLPIKPHA